MVRMSAMIWGHVGGWLRDGHSLHNLVERAAFAGMIAAAVSSAAGWVPLTVMPGAPQVTATMLLVAATVGFWLLSLTMGGLQARPAFGLIRDAAATRLMWAIGIWLAVLFASVVAAPSHNDESLLSLLKVLAGVLLASASYSLSYSRRRWDALARTLALVAVALAVLGLADVAGVGPVVSWLVGFREGAVSSPDGLRLSSTLPHPNVAAMSLLLTLPLLLAWAATSRSLLLHGMLTIGVVIGVAALGLTQSRAGIAVGLLILGAATIWGLRRRSPVVLRGGLVAIGALSTAIACVFLLSPSLASRMLSDGGTNWRYGAGYTVPLNVAGGSGEELELSVGLTNNGLLTWRTDDLHPFYLSYHILSVDKGLYVGDLARDLARLEVVIFEGRRTVLPVDVSPLSGVDVLAQVVLPADPGRYVIVWDMVQEGVTWFSNQGTPFAFTHVEVSGVPTGEVRVPDQPRLEDPADLAPTRWAMWSTAWQVALDRPLLGVGIGNFRWHFRKYAGVDQPVPHAHSAYFEWLSGTGFLGLLAFLWMVVELGRALIRRAASGLMDTNGEIWQLACTTSLAAWLAHGFFEAFYGTTTYVMLAIILGLALRCRPSSPG
jgi:hypothetical protein